jgi:hypothetical protein
MARWLGWVVLLGSVGCVEGKPSLDGGQEGPDPSSSSSDEEGADTEDDVDPSVTTTPHAESGESSESGDEESSTGCSFIDCGNDTDVCGEGGVACECDVWAQDCPEGEKCAPWANDGGTAWNATKCVSIDSSPGQPGDPCVAEGGGLSGLDDCAGGAMCWDVDETGTGVCIGFCSGNEASPVCEDPDASCVIANDGVLILCLPSCDPLLSDCGDGSACYPTENSFVCVFDSSGENGAYGDPCEFTNACDPGLWCAPAQGVPGCTTGSCCTPFCDQAEPDASAQCPGAAGGQECVPWYEEGQEQPGFEDVGSCLIPA